MNLGVFQIFLRIGIGFDGFGFREILYLFGKLVFGLKSFIFFYLLVNFLIEVYFEDFVGVDFDWSYGVDIDCDFGMCSEEVWVI